MLMQDIFDPTIAEWELSIELARSFLPDDPMNAAARLAQVERQLRETIALAGEASAELQELSAYVASLAEEARVAVRRWQGQSAVREERFHLREMTQPVLH